MRRRSLRSRRARRAHDATLRAVPLHDGESGGDAVPALWVSRVAGEGVTPPYQYIVLHESCCDHPGVIAVHAAHAAGESCVHGPAAPDTRVVALVAPSSDALRDASSHLRAAGIQHVLIVETDGIRAGQATALGVEPLVDRERAREILKAFKVLR